MDPEPPAWALAAGLPAPTQSETFIDYCVRLGVDPEPLLDGLNERTECIANRRLAHRIRLDMPRAWQAHMEEWLSAHIKPERRRELQAWGRANLPRDIG